MRTVLYSSIDNEPITIIDLPESTMQIALNYGRVKVHVMQKLEFKDMFYEPSGPLDSTEFKTVEIELRAITWHDKSIQYFMFTSDDENALELKSLFLPGQQKEIIEERKKAFAKGFIDAISRIIKGE